MELVSEYLLLQLKSKVESLKNEWVKLSSMHLQDINLLEISIDDIPNYLVTRGVISNVFFEEMTTTIQKIEELLNARGYNADEVEKLEEEIDKTLTSLKIPLITF